MHPQHISYLKHCLDELRQGEEVGKALLTQLQIFIELAEQQQSLTLPKDTVFAQIESQMSKASASEDAFRKRLQKLNQEFVDSEMGIRLASRKTQILISIDADIDKIRQHEIKNTLRENTRSQQILSEEETVPSSFKKPCYKVLISHAHQTEKEEEIIDAFIKLLRPCINNLPKTYSNQFAVELIYDKDDMHSRADLKAQTQKVSEEADYGIFMLSPSWFGSKYCQLEREIIESKPTPDDICKPYLCIQQTGSRRYNDAFKDFPTLPEKHYPEIKNLLFLWNEDPAIRGEFVEKLRDEICQYFASFVPPLPPAENKKKLADLVKKQRFPLEVEPEKLLHNEFARNEKTAKLSDGSGINSSIKDTEEKQQTPNELNTEMATVNAVELTTDWLSDEQAKQRIMVILGGFGMGKTTTTQRLANHLIEIKHEVLPIYLDFRRLTAYFQTGQFEGKSLKELIDITLNDGNEKYLNPDDVIDLIRNVPCVVILDGLDEIGNRIGYAHASRLYRQFFQLIPNDVWQQEDQSSTIDWQRCPTRLIVTCRTHFFRNINEEHSMFNVSHRASPNVDKRIRVEYMAPLSLKQIKSLFTKTLGTNKGEQLFDEIRKIHDLSGVAARPIMAKLISEVADEIIARHQQHKTVNIATIYEELFTKGVLRDEQEKAPLLQSHDRMTMLIALAGELHQQGNTTPSSEMLDDWLDEFASHHKGVGFLMNNNRAIVQTELRNSSFLVRSGDNRFTFAHTSFYEYFLGVFILKTLLAEQSNLDALIKQPVSVETLLFCRAQAEQTQQLNALKQAVATILQSSAPKSHRIFALRLWRLWDEELSNPPIGSCFDELDLQNLALTSDSHWQSVSLKNTQLNGLDAQQAYFDGVDFNASIIANSYFDRCSFSNCRGKPISAASARLRQNEMDSDSQAVFADTVLHWQHSSTRPKTKQSDTAYLIGQARAPIKHAVFSSDGKWLLTTEDKIAKLWDTRTTQCLQTFNEHSDNVNSAVFSSDNNKVLTASRDNTAKCFDAKTGECLQIFNGHSSSVNSAVFSSDNTQILTASWDKTAKCFDAKTGKRLKIFKGHSRIVNSAVFSSDNHKILTASNDNTAKCFDAKTGQCLQTFNGHSGFVTSATFSSDNNKILTASDDYTAKCFDVKTGQCLQIFNGHSLSINAAVFSSDNNKILTASFDRTAKCFDANTGECLQTFNGHSLSVNSVVFSNDNNQILTASSDDTAKCFDTNTGKCLQTFNGHSSVVLSAAFSSDNHKILTASSDNTAKCFDAKTGECLQTFNGHSLPVNAAVFSSDNTQILTASSDDTAKCFDANTGECLQTFNGHSDTVSTAIFSSDNTQILTASRDNTAKCFDAKTGQCLQTFNGHYRSVTSAVFSSDNNKILTASRDNTAKCFDVRTGECLQTFKRHSSTVTSAVFSSDNTKILTASYDNTAKCFDAKTGKCLQTFKGHSNYVTSAVFSSDNNNILTASRDNTAKCFDANTRDCLKTFNGHSSSVNTAVFSKDEKKILTASNDGTVRIWSLASGEALWILQVFKDATAVIDTEGRIIHHDGDIWRYAYGLLNGEVVCPAL